MGPGEYAADASPARERSNSEPEFHGSAESVIRESTATIGWGFLDALFTSPGLPFEKARRSLELFGTEVLPQLTR